MEHPKISVIIPIYKTEPYLRKCLDSVVYQTYRNLEVILVDDGSPDNCGVICDEYAIKDERVRVVHKKNGGLSSARNTGLEIMSGDWVSFVDSDDTVRADFIEQLYSACKTAKADLAMCASCTEYEQLGKGSASFKLYNGLEMCGALCSDRSGDFGVAWNKLYARKLFEGIRFPTGRIHEDEAVVYQLFWRAKRCVVLDHKLYFYRQRIGSIVRSPFSIRNLDAATAYQERIRFYDDHGEQALSDYTKATYCYFLRKNIGEIYKVTDQPEYWRRELWSAYRGVLRSNYAPAKKKLGLTLHMLSPVVCRLVKRCIYGLSSSDQRNCAGL